MKMVVPNTNGELGVQSVPQTADIIYMLGNSTWNMVDAVVLSGGGIKSDGTLWVWGANFGQLPFGNMNDQYQSQTQVGTASNWKYVTMGMYHGLALNQNNELWSWGDPEFIGNGTDTGPGTPILIPCPQ